MKARVLILAIALGQIIICFGQEATLELTFKAEFNGNNFSLDSILIENQSQGSDTVLYAPDTVFVLDYFVGLNEGQSKVGAALSVSQNYPNPFKDKTSFSLFLPGKEKISITVHDVLGRELLQYENVLNWGHHSFTFYPGNEKCYLLSVNGKQASKTIKMLCSNVNTVSKRKCNIVHEGYRETGKLKSEKAITDFKFSIGDELLFTGYAKTYGGIHSSDIIADNPESDTNYVFTLIKGIKCPGIDFITDIDSNLYNAVQIGDQCWMAENLKTTTYKNGISIPNVINNIAWDSLTTGAYAWYNNNITGWTRLYGVLYNWFAVIDSNGLCPEGWHVPTHEEWTILTDYVGGIWSANTLKSCRQINSPLGGYCNTTQHPRWVEHDINYGTDNHGFAGLAGGERTIGFDVITAAGYWWSSTQSSSSPSEAWSRVLSFGGLVTVKDYKKQHGHSVRCLKD